LFLLLVATLLQMRLLLTDFVWPRTQRYWGVHSFTAWERSALLSEGQDFLDFVKFLRDTIPDTGKVVLPPSTFVGEAGAFTYVTFMQYFMIPREVLNCTEPVDECVLGLDGPNSYLVRIGGFPPAESAEVHKVYVPFRADQGVYVPK
jgi:hypothetical protein